MGNDKWNADEIEKRLRDLPIAEDRRDKEEILQRLKDDPRLSKQATPNKRLSKSKWPPIIAAVAAMFLLIILLPAFFLQDNQVSMDKETTHESAPAMEMSPQEEIQTEDSQDTSAFTRQMQAPLTNAAYAADVADGTAFHIGLATDEATIVPVTFLIAAGQLPEELKEASDAVALYNAFADKVDEKALGFAEYHPYDASVSSTGKTVRMKFLTEHSYDRSSATLGMLNLSVQDTFRGFDEVEFLQEDSSPIVFDQVGEIKEPLKLTNAEKHQAYYQLEKSDGEIVLSPNFGKTFVTVQEALGEMKKTPNDVYSTVLPEGMDFKTTVEKDVVKVEFDEIFDLDSFEPEETLRLIEAILLTAASFDKHVQFTHIMQDQWNRFDFTQPLEKPIGANPKYLINE